MSKRITLLCAIVFALAAGSAFAADQVKGPFAGAVHAVGSLSDKSGNPISITWDRGKITSLSDTSITLTRRDKAQVSFAITADTAVRNDGGTYHLSDLKTGLVATVVSQSGNAEVIRNIRGDGAPTGADQSAIDGPAKGSVTGSIDAAGNIIISGVNPQNTTITRWDATGTVTPTQLRMNFTVTFAGGASPAFGTIALNKP